MLRGNIYYGSVMKVIFHVVVHDEICNEKHGVTVRAGKLSIYFPFKRRRNSIDCLQRGKKSYQKRVER